MDFEQVQQLLTLWKDILSFKIKVIQLKAMLVNGKNEIF